MVVGVLFRKIIPMKKALIFGANGQDGYYLNQLCRAKGIESIGISRAGKWIFGDVSSYEQVKQLIKNHLPDYIFHIAANSSTQHDKPIENYNTISTGTINILESVKECCPSAKVFITGSGLQFKNNGNPIAEEDEFEAVNPYSMARIQSVYAARYYRSLGLHVYVGYLFHHESPLRESHFVSQLIAQAARRIADGSKEIIELGDISVRKEWTFAGDTVKGIFNLIEQDKIFEAVIGSGTAYSIEDWLEKCFKIINQSWHGYVRIKKEDIPKYKCLVSNPKKIFSLGWKPKVNINELAEMMVNSSVQVHL